MIVKASQTISSKQSKRLFESMAVVVFQSVFHSEMHQNNIFLFLKNYF